MRTSQILISTLKEDPADAEVISHKLMLRAGLIRKLAAGLYTWLPMGLKVLRRVETIIREEMDRSGAQEVLMPSVQPAELWQESERWDQYGPELLRLNDRHQREFCYGPTHEEVITDLIRREIKSYKQLPANFYQVQTKFRDEIRPRFGIMRAREFLMKDAYSFHVDKDSLDQTYQDMHDAYSRIFQRCGLNFRPVRADSGAIGGSQSHEFHVLAESGEDAIAFSNESDYAANIEAAETLAVEKQEEVTAENMATVDTPDQHTIEEVSAFLGVPAQQCLKTLIALAEDDSLVALVLRGDHQLNEIKAAKLEGVASPVQMASAERISAELGCDIGSLGPVGLNIPLLVDHAAAAVSNFICGANETGKHLTGTNWGRDCDVGDSVDLRNVVAGDPSPDGNGTLSIARGIEVGHIFQLGDKYSRAMQAEVLDENGKTVTMTMGCYGIGVSRVVAAAIEQNHDEHGIVWPTALAPYTVALLPMNMAKSDRVRETVAKLYQDLKTAGIEVLLDDRNVRPGIMFADMELIGIPHRIVVGEKGLADGNVEYKGRTDSDRTNLPLDEAVPFIRDKITQELA